MQRPTPKRTGARPRPGVFRRRRSVELIFDLSPIRARLGDKWDKIAPSVRRFARHVIERHVGGGDEFELDGDAFVIRFSGTRPEEAAQKVRSARTELEELLFGSGDLSGPAAAHRRRSRRNPQRRWRHWLARIRHAFDPFKSNTPDRAAEKEDTEGEDIGNVDATADNQAGKVAALPDKSYTPSAPVVRGRARARSRSRRVASGGLPRSEPAASLQKPDMVEPEKPLRPVASDFWRIDHPPSGSVTARARTGPESSDGRSSDKPLRDDESAKPVETSDEAESVMDGSSRTAGRVRRAATEALERALFAAIQEAERQQQLATQARMFPPLGTRFLYRPLWLIERGVLPIYSCTPACALGPFEFVTGEALLDKNIGARKIAMLDEMLISHVAADLRTRMSTQIRSVICVPVHYETLTGDRNDAWMEALRTIPDRIRRNVMVEIIGVSQGVGQLATYSLVRKLRSHVRDVIGRLELNDVNFHIWRETDLGCVGVDLESDNRPEIDVISELNDFVAPAKQHGMRTYARGVRSLSLAAAAIASGIDYLDGPAVDEGDLVLEVHPKPFGIIDIYRQ